MNKKIILLLLLLIIVSMGFYMVFYEKDVEVSGSDVYQALNLEKCYRIFVRSIKYKEDGVLVGEEHTYVITKNDKVFNQILDLIKNTDSESNNLKDYVPNIINQVTHHLQFDIKGRTNVHLDYSSKTNELLFADDALRDVTNNNEFILKAILMNMDERFNEVITRLK